jgi:hypothetical protein
MADIFSRGNLSLSCQDCGAVIAEAMFNICLGCRKTLCDACLHNLGMRVTKMFGGDLHLPTNVCTACKVLVLEHKKCPECLHPLDVHNPDEAFDPFAPQLKTSDVPCCSHSFTLFTSVERCACKGRLSAFLKELGH